MAIAATQGELRRVEDAVVDKRFRPAMTSRTWGPRGRRDARQLRVQHTARLTELAFSVCPDDDERRRLLMAAVVRMCCEGLHTGVPNAGGRRRPFRARVLRELRRELEGPAAELAGRTPWRSLRRDIDADAGIIGASRLARQLRTSLRRGDREDALSLYRTARAMDPLAGWVEPFRRALGAG
jgi:hypothetical protein